MRDGCQRAPSARQKPAFFSVSVRPFARSFDTSLLPLPSASLDRFQRLNLKMICPALLIIDEST